VRELLPELPHPPSE
nr:Chain C, CONSERVED ARCHAEAL PROTEIN [Sulfolobus acidocaldarius]2W2U_D Chain D, CONSERVED ARCHAEAL PROTEIN [Sulfolobus acidocaldarius]